MASRVKGALTRKLGPLPAWAWLGIAAGAILLYRHLKGGSLTGSTTTPGTSQSASGYTAVGTPAIAGGASGDGGLPPPDTTVPTDQGTSSLGGIGTPVIFDPATGAYDTTTPPAAPPPTGGRPRSPGLPDLPATTNPPLAVSHSGAPNARIPGTGHTSLGAPSHHAPAKSTLAATRNVGAAAKATIKATRSAASSAGKRKSFTKAITQQPGGLLGPPVAPATKGHQAPPTTAPSVTAALAASKRTGTSVVKIKVVPPKTPAPLPKQVQAALVTAPVQATKVLTTAGRPRPAPTAAPAAVSHPAPPPPPKPKPPPPPPPAKQRYNTR